MSSRPEPSRPGCHRTSFEPPPLLLPLHKAPVCREEASSLPSEGPGAPAPAVLRSQPCSASQLRPLCLWPTQLPAPSLPPPTPAPSWLLLLGLHRCSTSSASPLGPSDGPLASFGPGKLALSQSEGTPQPRPQISPWPDKPGFLQNYPSGWEALPWVPQQFLPARPAGSRGSEGPPRQGLPSAQTPFSSVHPSHTPRPWPALCPSLLPPSLGILTALFSLPGTHLQDG